MATDYKKIGEDIVRVIGKDNIQSITHCATRLRLEVKDRDAIDDKEIEKIDQVKGLFFNAGQYQIILGTGTVNKVYESIVQGDKEIENRTADLEEVKKDGNPIKRGIRTLADIFIPIIPGIVATGLFLGLKGVVLNDTVLSWFGASADQIPEYITILMSVLTDTVFAFLPALICWSATRGVGLPKRISGVVALIITAPS